MLQLSNASGRRVGPHRVFNAELTAPGLAMSRSLGDGYAHSLGVSAVPTCTAHKLTPADQFVVGSRTPAILVPEIVFPAVSLRWHL